MTVGQAQFIQDNVPRTVKSLILCFNSNLSRLATPTSLSKPNLLTHGICLNRETGQGALVCLDVTLEVPE